MRRKAMSLSGCVLLLALMTQSCATEGDRGPASTADLPALIRAAGPAAGWETGVSFSNQGTRSEGRSHYLLYRGCTLPDVFDRVVIVESSYRFLTRQHAWGDDGYVADGRAILPLSDESLAPGELERGYYPGSARKLGTPAEWFYAERGNAGWFVDAAKVDDLASAENLSCLPRLAVEALFQEGRQP